MSAPNARTAAPEFEGCENTVKSYRQGWARWRDWAEQNGASAAPAEREDILSFALHLSESGRSAATLRMTLSAISRGHRGLGMPSPFSKALRSETRKIARGMAQVQRRDQGITLKRLRKIEKAMRVPRGWETEKQTLRRVRFDAALLNAMRDGMLRVSEAEGLAWRDIEARKDGSAVVSVRDYRTSPRTRKTRFSKRTMGLLKRMAGEGTLPPPEERVFGLSKAQISRRVKAAASAAGFRVTADAPKIGKLADLERSAARKMKGQ